MVCRRTLLLFGVLVGLFMLGGASRSTAQTSFGLPYVMYFVPQTNNPHFIIERVDGTDSRPFGGVAMNPTDNYVDGPGWSPSGEWFAWTSAEALQALPVLRQPHVLSVDGQRGGPRPDGIIDAVLSWSPYEDLLLMAVIRQPDDASVPIVELWLQDYDTYALAGESISLDSKLLYRGDAADYNNGSLTTDVLWDQQRVYVRASSVGSSIALALTFDVDTGDLIAAVDPDIRLGVDASASGWYVNSSETGFTLTNLLAGEPHPIDMDSGLYLTNVSLAGTAYLAESELGSLYVVNARGRVPTYEQVNQARPIDYVSHVYDPDGTYTNWDSWSPDGRYVLLSLLNELYVLDTITFARQRLPIQAPRALFYRWVDNDSLVMVQDQILAGNANAINPYTLYLIDIDDLSLREIAADAAPQNALFSNPAGTRLVTLGTRIDIYNATVGFQTITLPPDPRGYFTGFRGARAIVHPTAEYFISDEDALVAGGGTPRFYGVHGFDGILNRTLGECVEQQPICAFWLPDSVAVDRLPAGADNPEASTEGLILRRRHVYLDTTYPDDYWVYLLAFSPDGSRVAAGGIPHGEREMTLYDPRYLTRQDGFRMEIYTDTLVWTDGNTPTVVEGDAATFTADFLMGTDPSGRHAITEAGVLSDVATGNEVFRFPQAGFMGSAGFSPDGELVAVRGLIYAIAEGRVVARVPGAGILSNAFSPDGTLLAVGRGWMIELWDVETVLAAYAIPALSG